MSNASFAEQSTESGSTSLETRDDSFSDSVDDCTDASEGWFRNLNEVTSKPLEWVWDGLIPRGKLTLITGEPGVGKSLFAMYVAAMVTRGLTRPKMPTATTNSPPHCSDSTVKPSGAVLLISADDGLADTVRPRLEASRADISKVFILSKTLRNPAATEETDQATGGGIESEGFRLERDLDKLETQLRALQGAGADLRLIVIDPIDCYLNSTDKNARSPDIVTRLVELAERCDVAVLIVANSPSPMVGRPSVRSAIFSHEQLAHAARSVLVIARDLEHEQQRLVLPVKLNLCETRSGMAFSIQNGALVFRSRSVPLTGDEYFVQAKEQRLNPLNREEHSEIDRVTNWLKERLSKGSVLSVDIRNGAYDNEIAYTTLRRAFRRLGCQASKPLGTGRWYWRLPGQSTISSETISEEVDQESLFTP